MTAVEEKRFATLQAKFALSGHAFFKAKPDDQQAAFYCARWGWLRPLSSLDAAERLLRKMGGTS